MPASAGYAIRVSMMAESSWAETITSFLKIRKSPFTALNHISVSDVNYNDPSIILHRKRCDPPQTSGKSEQPMAQYQSKAGFGASFWNGALPASSFSVVFLFKHFLSISVLVIPAQKRILICNM